MGTHKFKWKQRQKKPDNNYHVEHQWLPPPPPWQHGNSCFGTADVFERMYCMFRHHPGGGWDLPRYWFSRGSDWLCEEHLGRQRSGTLQGLHLRHSPPLLPGEEEVCP